MTQIRILDDKRTILFIVLCSIFLTNAIIAELIGIKIFSAESVLGLSPANIQLLDGFVLDFNLTAGVVVWPIVFITTDIINEYYGKDGVKKISYITVIFIAYIFVVIYLVTILPPAEFWLQVNKEDVQGNFFDMAFAFRKIFRQGMGIIVGSLIAFLVSQLLDVYVFHKLRKITGSKNLWLRATGSTLVSQLIDSFVVLAIAFYIFGDWSIAQVISVGIINYLYKFGAAVLLTPVLYIAHFVIDSYLGKNTATMMMAEASRDTTFA
ncbi:queuosine precursor transporter [soil metagenome]